MTDFRDILETNGVREVFKAIEDAGGESYIVGGAVRDHLLGRSIGDIDFATSLAPEAVDAACQKQNIKTIPTGIQHGTLTALVGAQAFEITSYRVDEATDGRRAKVKIGGTIETDAARRDFTINALYLSKNGVCLDPLGEGLADIVAKRLRFIGTASHRIQEDYLRILRYFRFLANYQLSTVKENLDAIALSRDGLTQISAERIGQEMRKLVTGDYALSALREMEVTGVTKFIGEVDLDTFASYLDFEAANKLAKDRLLRIAALMVDIPRKEWCLTKREVAALKLFSAPPDFQNIAIYGYRFGEEMGLRVYLRHCFLARVTPVEIAEVQVAFGAAQVFPIDGDDLMAKGLRGKDIGAVKSRLEMAWLESDFQLERTALLSMLD